MGEVSFCTKDEVWEQEERGRGKGRRYITTVLVWLNWLGEELRILSR